ncbi:MAG TPA: sulfatase-like hydrolase/transferase [Bryobacteraceae bacterium]|nr:sulfatase-like hydrolase/transferase [Bryobacteraceae bacterium]
MRFTRRDFTRTLGAGLAAPFPPMALSQPRGRPKNVLLLMSDQHRPRALGVDGHPVAKTPNLDKLARSGVRFDHAYCSNPVCVPSRASLLTGLYTHNHKAYNNGTPWPFEKKTIAHYLGRAGYMTALIGKMHFVDGQTHGFDYRLDFNDWFQYLGPKTKLYADELGKRNSGSGNPQIDDLWRDAGDPWLGTRTPDGRKGLVTVGATSKFEEKDHFESFVTRESIRFLKNHASRQPFFLITSYLKPHDPFTPAERFDRMFRAEDMPIPDTWGKVDLASVPKEVRESITNDWVTPEMRGNPEAVKRHIAYYYANLAQMDDNVGVMLNALRELKLEDDTIVLYTTDHGEMLGEHGLFQKMQFYEPAVGVPLIVRAPGVTPANARSRTLVSQTGVVPTLLELCGLPVPAGLDGESFVADLREPGKPRQTTVFAEYALRSPRAKGMIREGDFKYCYYKNDIAELFNLKDDPREMKNLALDPKYAAKVAAMQARLFAWHKPD